jgi:hypothetical protein
MSLTKTLYQGGTLDVDELEWQDLARGYFPALDLTPHYSESDALRALFLCHIFPKSMVLIVVSYLDVWTKVQEPAPSTYRLTHQIRMYNHTQVAGRNHRAAIYYEERAQVPWSIAYQPLKFWFEQRLQRNFCSRCGEAGAYHHLIRKGTCVRCQLDGREREIIDDLNYRLNSYLCIRQEWSCVFVHQEEVRRIELEVPGYENI